MTTTPITRCLPETVSLMAPEWRFSDARQALFWSVEVLRRRRWPKLSGIWKEMGLESADAETELVAAAWRPWLPEDPADKYALALKVAGLLTTLGADGRLLELQAWGDWADEKRLRAALAFKERMRRDGVRVLLNYRYTFRQLAEMQGTDPKAVWRQTRTAMRRLEEALRVAGLLWHPDTLKDGEGARPAKVLRDAFGKAR